MKISVLRVELDGGQVVFVPSRELTATEVEVIVSSDLERGQTRQIGWMRVWRSWERSYHYVYGAQGEVAGLVTDRYTLVVDQENNDE